jgi:hypothetical protein
VLINHPTALRAREPDNLVDEVPVDPAAASVTVTLTPTTTFIGVLIIKAVLNAIPNQVSEDALGSQGPIGATGPMGPVGPQGPSGAGLVTTIIDNTLFTSAGAVVVPADDTRPTAAEGISFNAFNYTAQAVGNVVDIEVNLNMGSTGSHQGVLYLCIDGSDAVAATWVRLGLAAGVFLALEFPMILKASYVAVDLLPHAFDVRVGASGVFVFYINGDADTAARLYGGAASSIITITERTP